MCDVSRGQTPGGGKCGEGRTESTRSRASLRERAKARGIDALPRMATGGGEGAAKMPESEGVDVLTSVATG